MSFFSFFFFFSVVFSYVQLCSVVFSYIQLCLSFLVTYLHARHGHLNASVEGLGTGLGEHLVVDAVLALLLGQDVAEVLVHVLGEERCEGCHGLGESEQDLEEDVQGHLGIGITGLEAAAVEANVPVGQLAYERQQAGHHCVQSVGCMVGMSQFLFGL